MPDDATKPAEAETLPAPASESPKPAEIIISPLSTGGYSNPGIELPMDAWVKGGTRSSRRDREIAETEADAEHRRNVQDQERAIASIPIEQGGGKMFSHHFGHPTDDTKILVKFVNSKKETDFELLCDIGVSGNADFLYFQFPCPDCVSRGVPQGQCQLLVRDNHRKWSLDDRTKGEIIRWRDDDGLQIYYSAGRIKDTEILQCSNDGCSLCVKIHDNMMYRVPKPDRRPRRR